MSASPYGGSPFRNRAGTKNVEAVVDDGGHQVWIEYPHDAVHRDIYVTASEYLADLDVASPRVYLLKPPTGFAMHSIFNVEVSAPARIQLFKGPTVTADGTPLTHMRHNFGSEIANDARISSFHSPTVSDNGEAVLEIYTGGGAANPANRVGGSARNGEEIVIPAGSAALLIVTAIADNTILSFSNAYYEVAE